MSSISQLQSEIRTLRNEIKKNKEEIEAIDKFSAECSSVSEDISSVSDRAIDAVLSLYTIIEESRIADAICSGVNMLMLESKAAVSSAVADVIGGADIAKTKYETINRQKERQIASKEAEITRIAEEQRRAAEEAARQARLFQIRGDS